MTFNTVTPALASPPPAYSIGFLHFLKLATSIPIQTSSTNKKSASDIYGTEYVAYGISGPSNFVDIII